MDAPKNRRRSLRLRNYDYTKTGAYFVTLCILDQACLLGTINDRTVHLNETGKLVQTSWVWLSTQYPYVYLDEFVIMPNHLHGIMIISDQEDRSRTALTKVKSLGSLVAAFKTVSTKSINAYRGTPSVRLWQRNYYEHVIRNETDLARVREYIGNNPAQWELDEENLSRHS